MTDKELKSDMEKIKRKKQIPAWGLLIGVVSVLFGEYIIRVDGFFVSVSEPILRNVNENGIGSVLLVLGVVKIISLLLDCKFAARLSIILLTVVWSALFMTAFAFSFGTGYPHPSYISNGAMAVACLIVSWRGNFTK